MKSLDIDLEDKTLADCMYIALSSVIFRNTSLASFNIIILKVKILTRYNKPYSVKASPF